MPDAHRVVSSADTDAVALLGGKGAALARLERAGLPVPRWFAVTPLAADGAGGVPTLSAAARGEIVAALARLGLPGEAVAVRSSAIEEDGLVHSFAGQLESHLFVMPDEVFARIEDVWRSAASERVCAYRRERGLDPVPRLPAVLVQRMIDASAAGVAFSADPVTGRRAVCVVAAVPGLGTALVSGEQDADTFRVSRDGAITSRDVADKRVAHRRGPRGPVALPLDAGARAGASLTDPEILAVAALARRAERHAGAPQDIEWAIAGGELHLLQSRPITALADLADPDGAIAVWDNSNITESYGGVTTPLTFSFARHVYEGVYRQFLRMLGVRERRLAEHDDALGAMIGLIRGRVYYDLVSWNRILALLPGYTVNRSFMEQMMGVREPLPEGALPEPPPAGGAARWRDAAALGRSVVRLLVGYARLPGAVRRFHVRLDDALDLRGRDLAAMRPDELVTHYRELERRLLDRWDAPLLNDFFAMILHGVLGKLAERWCGERALQNDLVAGDPDIISAEPVRRMRELATVAARDPELTRALCEAPVHEAVAALRANPELGAAFDAHLARFGDRCLEELKLETLTLADDPTPLVRAIGGLARHGGAARDGGGDVDLRREAERRAYDALRRSPLRRAVLARIVRHTRARVRDRENLRFERTRVFGRVRRIVVELGRRLAAAGALGDARDVFLLTLDEVIGFVRGTAVTTDLRALVEVRRIELARWREMPAPADRFVTRGLVHVGHDFREPTGPAGEHDAGLEADTRRGVPCYPGAVHGRARVVRDPRTAVVEPGEILVAERTDPGWVMLFGAAAGLLVERGSLLSHSAIVARELRLPAIVGVAGLTGWLRTGDAIVMDGRAGTVRRLTTDREATGGIAGGGGGDGGGGAAVPTDAPRVGSAPIPARRAR